MPDCTVHHCGITVADLDRAVDFYTDVFELDVVDRFSVGGEAFATGVDVPDASGRFAHLDAGDARIELVEYEPVGDARDDAALNQPGAVHLGLTVADVDAFYESLPDGVETLSPPQTTESGTTLCFVRDPEGNLIEVLEE